MDLTPQNQVKRVYIFRGIGSDAVFLMIEFTSGKTAHISLTAIELYNLITLGVLIEND